MNHTIVVTAGCWAFTNSIGKFLRARNPSSLEKIEARQNCLRNPHTRSTIPSPSQSLSH